MQTDKNEELREAVMYTRYSLLITVVSLPFALMGHILRNSSSFAIEIMSYGIVGFVFGLLMLLFWYRKWSRLKNQDR